MANPEHRALLKQGVKRWNEWRENHPEIRPDLNGVDLSGKDLQKINLSRAALRGAGLYSTVLNGANLSGADLLEAKLRGTKLKGVDLRGARLMATDLHVANLSEAHLEYATLMNSVLVGTNLESANLTNCYVYGISVWDIFLEGAIQEDLVITPPGVPEIQVDNLEVAQFIYLLLNNQRVRQVIDTITSKVVLILGRFTEERKAVLNAIREELRRRNFIPLLFDFDKPTSTDVTGTVETLARMARFIIADLTDPSSIPHELATIVPFLRTTPVLPLRLAGSGGYSMFEDFQRAYTWVLKTHEYEDGRSLILALPEIIAPADKMADELRSGRSRRKWA
jgi:hypothetical protein